jgi:hypothetical protein
LLPVQKLSGPDAVIVDTGDGYTTTGNKPEAVVSEQPEALVTFIL